MKAKFLAAGAGLAAMLSLVYLYAHGQSQLARNRQALHAVISRALQASVSLDASLLKAHDFLLNTDENEKREENELRAACSQLRIAGLTFEEPHENKLNRESSEICDLISEKLTAAEAFEKKNFSVSEDVLFLHALALQTRPHLRNAGGISPALLASAMAQYVRPGTENAGLLLKECERLEKEGNLVAAARLRGLVEGQRESDLLLQQVLASPVESALEQFRHDYMEAFENAEATANLYRRLLFWSSLLLLAAVLFGVAKVVEASRRLREANERLEQRVKERTQELSASHELIVQQQNSLVGSTKMSALGEMAGGVAHEINNPLAIIQTISVQLTEVLGEEEIDRPLAIRMADSIAQTTDRIARIVQGLRTFSRDGSNDPFVPVSVPSLIAETIVLCRERFRSSGVKLVLENTDAPLAFHGRSTQLSQVLLNLLNNSLDAISANPERWVRIRASDEGAFVLITVEDSGTGLTPEVQKKMFQPFFTTKEIGKGTGLGLSISLGLIRSHGGTLEVFGSPNTRFEIRLPKEQGLARAA